MQQMFPVEQFCSFQDIISIVIFCRVWGWVFCFSQSQEYRDGCTVCLSQSVKMIEKLESRQLMSVTITGTTSNDTFELEQVGSQIFVWVDRSNTMSPNYRLPLVPVSIIGNGGTDDIKLDGDISVPITINEIGTLEMAGDQNVTIDGGDVIITIGDSSSLPVFTALRNHSKVKFHHNYSPPPRMMPTTRPN